MPQGTNEWYDEPIPPEILKPEGVRTTGEGFVVDDDGKAEWACAHVAKIDAEQAAIQVQAGAWRERINTWEQNQVDALQKRRGFFAGHLIAYLRTKREESNDQVKSITLPSGMIRSTSHGPAVTVENEDAFLQWVVTSSRNDLVRTKVAPDLKAIREALEGVEKDDGYVVIDPTSGETVPGVGVKPPSVSYRVEPS